MAGKGMQIRGGNRGGRDQFDWEDVKADKYRENYLGHSVKASVGRWQKGRDLTWYTKDSKVAGRAERLKKEREAIKRAEEEAMAAALGLKPPAPAKPQQTLTKQEMSEVCKRRSKDEAEEEREERVKGVGYQSRRAQAMFVGSKSTTTKEGATIFEHDAAVEDDGRLKMPESKRRSLGSVSDVTTPTAATAPGMNPTDLSPSDPTTAIPVRPVEPAVVTPDSKKTKKKKKKAKKHKEKTRKPRKKEDSSSSEADTESKKVTKRKKDKSKRKKKKRESSSDISSEAEWAEKEHSNSVAKNSHRRSRSPHRQSKSPRRHSRSPRRRSRSPRRRSRSPRRRSRSPRRRSKSPRRWSRQRSKSPRRRSRSPRGGGKRSRHRSSSSSSGSSRSPEIRHYNKKHGHYRT